MGTQTAPVQTEPNQRFSGHNRWDILQIARRYHRRLVLQ
jgi:hypothetical protein